MCPEGVKMGRKIETDVSVVSLGIGATETLLNADSNRIGVSLALGSAGFGVDTDSITIFARSGSAVITVANFGRNTPRSIYLGISEYGSIVTGPLFALSAASGVTTIGVVAVKLTYPLV